MGSVLLRGTLGYQPPRQITFLNNYLRFLISFQTTLVFRHNVIVFFIGLYVLLILWNQCQFYEPHWLKCITKLEMVRVVGDPDVSIAPKRKTAGSVPVVVNDDWLYGGPDDPSSVNGMGGV